MTAFPVDPYVTACADALKAAGHNVTDVWTEATDPVDHNICIVDGWSLVLIWDAARWIYILYPHPHATYRAAGSIAVAANAMPSELVSAVAHLIDTVVHA